MNFCCYIKCHFFKDETDGFVGTSPLATTLTLAISCACLLSSSQMKRKSVPREAVTYVKAFHVLQGRGLLKDKDRSSLECLKAAQLLVGRKGEDEYAESKANL